MLFSELFFSAKPVCACNLFCGLFFHTATLIRLIKEPGKADAAFGISDFFLKCNRVYFLFMNSMI